MKRSLGRILFLWFVSTGLAWGATYQWRVVKSPASLQVGQSGVVRYECAFDGTAAEYSVKLQFGENSAYKAAMLAENDRVVQGRRIETLDVLITPKTAGSLDVHMGAVVRFTTLGAIENTVLGRDNVGKDDIVEEKVTLPSITIQAKENTAALTGNITLEARADHASVRAHEPVHLTILVRGSGNLDQFIPYELNISGVKVFAEPPLMSINPSPEGYEGEIRQEFALVAEKSYVIAPLSLNVFDTAQNRLETLHTAPIHIEVGEGYEYSALLDPPDLSDRSALKRYALYASLVLAGAVAGETVRKLWKMRPRRRKKEFWDQAKTSKELVQSLSLKGDKRYDEIIRRLEEESLGLSEAKKKLSTLHAENEGQK